MAFFAQLGPDPYRQQAGQLGQAFGQGLSRKIGLGEVEKLAQSGINDPVKLAVALAKLTNYAPGLERSLGEVYKTLLERSQSHQVGEGLAGSGQTPLTNQLKGTPAQENGRISPNVSYQNQIAPTGAIPDSMNVPESVEQPKVNINIPSDKQYDAADIKNISQQFLSTFRPDLVQGSSTYGRIPPFNFASQSDLSRQEEGQLRQNLESRRYAPKAIDAIVQRTREDVKRAYDEKIKAFDIDRTQQEDMNKKWQTFKERSNEYLQPLLGKYDSTFGFGGKPRTANDLKNKYFQYAESLPSNLTPEQMHAQAGAMLQNDINRIDALAAIPPLPYVRDPKEVEENIKAAKEAYKPLLKEGFYESLKEDAVINKGMGLEELHYTLYGDTTDKSSLKKISDIKAPHPYIKGTEYSLLNFYKGKDILNLQKGQLPEPLPNPNYSKERDTYIKNLSQKLKNIKPDDDLILLRAQALNSGAQERDFNEALEMARQNGLNLSTFQESQQQELRIPRKRPLWEIFNPKAWAQWINYTAGKR